MKIHIFDEYGNFVGTAVRTYSLDNFFAALAILIVATVIFLLYAMVKYFFEGIAALSRGEILEAIVNIGISCIIALAFFSYIAPKVARAQARDEQIRLNQERRELQYEQQHEAEFQKLVENPSVDADIRKGKCVGDQGACPWGNESEYVLVTFNNQGGHMFYWSSDPDLDCDISSNYVRMGESANFNCVGASTPTEEVDQICFELRFTLYAGVPTHRFCVDLR